MNKLRFDSDSFLNILGNLNVTIIGKLSCFEPTVSFFLRAKTFFY